MSTAIGGSSPEPRRDSHDLQLNLGNGRESLVDNLLLSFDKIGDGSLGAFDTSPYFTSVDEMDDDDTASNYSQNTSPIPRGRRSNSTSNYHSHIGGFAGVPVGGSTNYGNRRVGSFDNGTESFGSANNFDAGRETRSRGRGLGSSHGFANVYDPFDAAPPPSIRSGPRNRTPSPPRSPRLVRRLSNKSNRSLRRDQQFNPHFEDPISLPPLPAFVNPATMNTKDKTPQRPGFFRRVFGVGGGSSTNASGGSSIASSKQPQEVALPPQNSDPPQSTINKKPSFFRRRKKSVSDAMSQPTAVLPPPLHATEPISPIECPPPQSPSTSLSAAMNSYLKSSTYDLTDEEDHEHAYLSRGATIRTVASSDPISPKRPTFFGESLRGRDSGSHFNDDFTDYKIYRKDTRYARGGRNVDLRLQPSKPKDRDDWDRPQTSPYTSTFSHKHHHSRDEEEPDNEMRWPPIQTRSILSTRRSVDNVALERERQNSTTSSVYDKPRQGSVVSKKETPIATVQELDAIHAKEGKIRKGSGRGKPLELDTRLGASLLGVANRGPGDSWLMTPTPATAAGTPTVMLQRDGPGEKAKLLEEHEEAIMSEDEEEDDEPSEETRELARKIFEGDEEAMPKAGVTLWLGDPSITGTRNRRAYMEMFDYSGINILSALRIFCGRLVFKGETQQVDRIITSISKRWCECNRTHGFKSVDIVFTILYSLLLLNTDLHIADLPQSQKMTRGQFIKNTMLSIRRIVAESAANRDTKLIHYNTMPSRSQTPYRQSFSAQQDDPGLPSAATFPSTRERAYSGPSGTGRGSVDFGRANRNSSKPTGIGNLSPKGDETSTEKMDYDMDGGLALVKNSLGGGIKVWETQVEIVLKDFYQSVKATALPLHGAQEKVEVTHSTTLSVFGSGMLRRSPSTVSRAPSELSVSNRNRDSKLGTKWTAKNRSRPRLYNGSYAASSRTSLEDRSMWSPSASSTWSKYSLDKTQTSMSVDSLGSAFTHGDYQQSIGFANALSHAIIREEAASGHSADDGGSTLLEYDELELSGAPWAKEGMLKHKHHLEGVDKKAKNRAWTECFAVIEKGWMKLFLFGNSQHKGGKNNPILGVVGGGNWTENAESIGTFMLRQTIASALPSPGYSKSKPNVWALSLPSGAVHFFEVGTAEIVREFVTTANYWAARLSKEPLVGGVSNVEYGWSENALGDYMDSGSPPSSNHGEPRPSLQVSIRSSIDHTSMVKAKLPGDKINITDWAPPTQSMVASSLKEADQLRALEAYVKNIESELTKHNELRPPMRIAFSPRHPNSAKAMANWERKSSYLLHEIIKFRTYIECLNSASILRERIRAGETEIGEAVGDMSDTEAPHGANIPIYSA